MYTFQQKQSIITNTNVQKCLWNITIPLFSQANYMKFIHEYYIDVKCRLEQSWSRNMYNDHDAYNFLAVNSTESPGSFGRYSFQLKSMDPSDT